MLKVREKVTKIFRNRSTATVRTDFVSFSRRFCILDIRSRFQSPFLGLSTATKCSVRCLLLLIGLLFHSALAAETVPSFTAHYTLSRSGIIVGETIRTLSPAPNGEFIYQSVAHATGLLARFLKDEMTERSRWVYQDDSIRPLNFLTQRHGGRKERITRQVFDWEKRVATHTSNGSSSQLPLPPNTQDKLSYQILLMHDLKKGLKKLEYIIAESDKTKIYRFVIMGEEILTTAIGTLRTLKIRRIGDERNTTVWCAIDRHYLPVKLEQHTDGDGHLELKIAATQGL